MSIEQFLENIRLLSCVRTVFVIKYLATNGATDYNTLNQEYEFWRDKNSLKNMYKSLTRKFMRRLEAEQVICSIVYNKYTLGKASEDLVNMLNVLDDFDNIKPNFIVSENFGYAVRPRMAKIYDVIDNRLNCLASALSVEEAIEKRKEIIFEENERRMKECEGKIILRYDWRK